MQRHCHDCGEDYSQMDVGIINFLDFLVECKEAIPCGLFDHYNSLALVTALKNKLKQNIVLRIILYFKFY